MGDRLHDVGVIGLAAMGSNLAMNIADHGFSVGVYNRSPKRTEELLLQYGDGKGIHGLYSIETFLHSLASPKKIILMVQAGKPVDDVLDALIPLLSEGDAVLDGGNSFFRDTIRREQICRKHGIHFSGTGISGGEEGARKGPSIMFGGNDESWKSFKDILESISARDFHGGSCATRIGSDGAGHYVKMIHNGIEYADMELIAESYFLMKHLLSLSNDAIADAFASFNAGRLDSYLVGITETILRAKDTSSESHIIDVILDTAENKGTGKWTGSEALELGTPSFGLIAAVFARYASAKKELRLSIAAKHSLKETAGKIGSDIHISDIEQALFAAKFLSYAQGYELLSAASSEYAWNFNLRDISRIWQGGCIIRARFLETLETVYAENVASEHLLLSDFAADVLRENIASLRAVSSAAIVRGIPIPGFLASLSYLDEMSSGYLPANLIQAQRDFFGAHTYRREINGPAEHFSWQKTE